MKKSIKSTRTEAARKTLTKKLESLRQKREACRKQFEAQLEKVWADHRAKMAKLRDERKAAYEAYDEKVKGGTKGSKRQSKKVVDVESVAEAETTIIEQSAEVAEVVEAEQVLAE